ncbi:MAG: guanylate kinase [Candidatus Omnitrophota bacterium]|nr:guanylate kinase [Candidatus Omnitrophota bacterium]
MSNNRARRSKVEGRRQGRIVIISGPSGSGKTTLHNRLLDSPRLKGALVKSISATTRSRRPGEKHGRDYLFLTPALFQHKIRRGHFLEWQKVFGNYYGTPRRQVRTLLNKGAHVLLCIDVKGAAVVRKEFPDALNIFIKTPSMKALRDRLTKRASENRATLDVRLKVAGRELKEARHYDHVVVNGRLDRAVRQLERIVRGELCGH